MLLLFFLALTTALLLAYAVLNHALHPSSKVATSRRLQQATLLGVRATAPADHTFDIVQALCTTAASLRSHTGLFVDDELNRTLLCAGYNSPRALDFYTAARLLLPMLTCLLGAFVPEGFGALWLLLTPVPAFLLPELLLRRQAAHRLARIRSSMPDMLDLLVICVNAGLGLDQAVARVARELELSHPDIALELLQVGRQLRTGSARQQAWADLASRLQLPEMLSFVNMILQTEKFGTPVSRGLSAFSQNNRLQRTQAAEEQAAKAAAKITIPLVLFIFPSIFIVLLGPAILTALRAFRAH